MNNVISNVEPVKIALKIVKPVVMKAEAWFLKTLPYLFVLVPTDITMKNLLETVSNVNMITVIVENIIFVTNVQELMLNSGLFPLVPV